MKDTVRRAWAAPAAYLAAAAVIVALLAPVQLEIDRGRAKLIPEASGDPQIVILNALGPLKPVAVDLLWLRAQQMQEQGKLYEVLLQCALITRLQPHLKVVWKFLTHNMFINIPAIFVSDEDRIEWMREGARLMDEGIRHNPDSYELYYNKAELYFMAMGQQVLKRDHRLWFILAGGSGEIDERLAVPQADLRTVVGRAMWLRNLYRVMYDLTSQARKQKDARHSLLTRQMAIMLLKIGEFGLAVEPLKTDAVFEDVVKLLDEQIARRPDDDSARASLKSRLKHMIYAWSHDWIGMSVKKRQTYIDKYLHKLITRYPKEQGRSAKDVIEEMERLLGP